MASSALFGAACCPSFLFFFFLESGALAPAWASLSAFFRRRFFDEPNGFGGGGTPPKTADRTVSYLRVGACGTCDDFITVTTFFNTSARSMRTPKSNKSAGVVFADDYDASVAVAAVAASPLPTRVLTHPLHAMSRSSSTLTASSPTGTAHALPSARSRTRSSAGGGCPAPL